MPIKFAFMKIVTLKVYTTISSPMTLTFIQGHKCVWHLTTFKIAIYRTVFKLLHSKIGMTVDVCMALNLTMTLKTCVRLVLLVCIKALKAPWAQSPQINSRICVNLSPIVPPSPFLCVCFSHCVVFGLCRYSSLRPPPPPPPTTHTHIPHPPAPSPRGATPFVTC